MDTIMGVVGRLERKVCPCLWLIPPHGMLHTDACPDKVAPGNAAYHRERRRRAKNRRSEGVKSAQN